MRGLGANEHGKDQRPINNQCGINVGRFRFRVGYMMAGKDEEAADGELNAKIWPLRLL